jgi:site-specific DNA recombinase
LYLAVWQDVCTLLTHPERLAEEYRRRLQPETCTKRTPLATIEDQISKVRQGVARLIDSYAESLIGKSEFEPRITRLRQRLALLEEQRQALAEEAALHGEWQLIIGRLEDFAAKLHDGLETADWASKRDLIRALVKRVEGARNEVNVVFRIDPYPSDNDPEKKSLQLCRGRTGSPAGSDHSRPRSSNGAPRNPSPYPGRSWARGMLLENSTSMLATL